MVHVAGAVKNPGVYTLPWSSRVTDAIQAAGGFSDDALLDAVNLASSLSDGEKITIPLALSTPSPVLIATPASKQSPLVNETRSSSGFPININNALAQDLERLPGIGPTKAQAIVLYRQENGSFKKLEDILKVPGIGQVTYDSIKELITINN